MALEDRGVDKKTFIRLQEEAKASINRSSHSLAKFSCLLTKHNLAGKFHLAFILEQLSKLGLDFKDIIGGTFFERLLRFSMNHALREVKFKARIPVPNSYQLVGVADEGQAYIREGVKEEDVFTLGPNRIYGAFLPGSTAVLPYANGNIQSVFKRAQMNRPNTSRAIASYPEALSSTLATVRIYTYLLRHRRSLLVSQCSAYTPLANRQRTGFVSSVV